MPSRRPKEKFCSPVEAIPSPRESSRSSSDRCYRASAAACSLSQPLCTTRSHKRSTGFVVAGVRSCAVVVRSKLGRPSGRILTRPPELAPVGALGSSYVEKAKPPTHTVAPVKRSGRRQIRRGILPQTGKIRHRVRPESDRCWALTRGLSPKKALRCSAVSPLSPMPLVGSCCLMCMALWSALFACRRIPFLPKSNHVRESHDALTSWNNRMGFKRSYLAGISVWTHWCGRIPVECSKKRHGFFGLTSAVSFGH
jgi:hypothetical protein